MPDDEPTPTIPVEMNEEQQRLLGMLRYDRLRNYGLLKFTHKEAFKTWVLSLPGILVASKAISDGQPWRISKTDGKTLSALHETILTANTELKTYDQFVEQLRVVCLPNVEVFETFASVLVEAHRFLPGYWDALRNPKLNAKQRIQETAARLAQLDALPQMEDFYTEFSRSVNVEQLLKDVDRPTEHPDE